MTDERTEELRQHDHWIDEIERLERVLKLTPDECLAGGFCRGMANRKSLNKTDREILTVAGKCIQRILNQQEAET